MSHGTGNVIDIDMQGVLDSEDQLACYIANMYTRFVTTPEWLEWVSTTNELLGYLYATDTSSTSNRSNPHSHNTHRPKLTQLYDTLEANYLHALFPHENWLQFKGGNEESNELGKRRKVEAYLRSRHRLYGHQQIAGSLVTDFLAMGNCVGEAVWNSKSAKIDEAGVEYKGYTGPRTRRHHPFRVAYNTRASSFAESPKIIQSIKTLGDIAKLIQDEEVPEAYREILTESMNFRRYLTANTSVFEQGWLDTPMQGFGTQGAYWSGGNVEILTFYGSLYDEHTNTLHDNRKITVVDRKWIIENEAIEAPDGQAPLFHVGWRTKPNSLLGMSPLANLVGMQYYINHMENTRADAFDKMATPDRIISGLDDTTQRADGGYDFYMHEGGQVRYLAPDTTALQADFKIEQMERKMEEYAGAPAAAAGIKVPGEQTKFQFAQLNNAAGRLFQRKINLFEDQMLVPLANAELDLAKRTLSERLSIAVIDPEIEEEVFVDVGAEDLKVDGGLFAVGARHYALQAQLVQELAQFTQATAGQDAVLRHLSGKKLAKAWDMLLSLGGMDGVYEENVRIIEETEAQQMVAAAQDVLARTTSASPSDPAAIDPAAQQPQ